MDDKNFEAQNAEVVAMTNRGQQLPRIPCYFVSEKQYRHYQTLKASASVAKVQERTREVNRAAAVAVRAGIGFLLLAAIPREWIHPIFGAAAGLASFLWAWAGWRRR